jgi:hypothetical protein
MKLIISGCFVIASVAIVTNASKLSANHLSQDQRAKVNSTLDEILYRLSIALDTTAPIASSATKQIIDNNSDTLDSLKDEALTRFRDHAHQTLESSIIGSRFDELDDANKSSNLAHKLSASLQQDWISSVNQIFLVGSKSDESVAFPTLYHDLQKRMKLPQAERVLHMSPLPQQHGNPSHPNPVRPVSEPNAVDVPNTFVLPEHSEHSGVHDTQSLKDFDLNFPEWKYFEDNLVIRYYNLWAETYIEKNPGRQTWTDYQTWMRSSEGAAEFLKCEKRIVEVASNELKEYLSRKLEFPLQDSQFKLIIHELGTSLGDYGKKVFTRKEYFDLMIGKPKKKKETKAKVSNGHTSSQRHIDHEKHLTEKIADQIFSEPKVQEAINDILFEAKSHYEGYWIKAFLKETSNDNTWARYKEWANSAEGLIELQKIQQQVLDRATFFLKDTFSDDQAETVNYLHRYLKSELDRELVVDEARFSLIMERSKPFEESRQNVGESQPRETQLKSVWKKVGLGVLISGVVIGLLLALILPFTLH